MSRPVFPREWRRRHDKMNTRVLDRIKSRVGVNVNKSENNAEGNSYSQQHNKSRPPGRKVSMESKGVKREIKMFPRDHFLLKVYLNYVIRRSLLNFSS